jgi:hypothetical protein
MPILLLGHWRWFPIAHRTKRIRVLPPIRGKLSRGATMAAEWFVDRVVPKFGRTFPPGALQNPDGGLGEQERTGVECVCAEIVRDRGLY